MNSFSRSFVIDADLKSGIENLLLNCAGLQKNDRLLIVVEPAGGDYYRDDLGAAAAVVAQEHGFSTATISAPIPNGPEDFPRSVLEALGSADKVIFFSRLGSQARFVDLPGNGDKIVSYTLDAASLRSPFGRLPYAFVQDLHDHVVARIGSARRYSIRCANGTDLEMTFDEGVAAGLAALAPFKVKNFPVMIFPPVSAARLSGKLVLTLALLPTSIHHYDDPVLLLDTPLALDIENGKITGFGGDAGQARRAASHFERVGKLVNGDPYSLNSWHTGINPATFFSGRAVDDLARWGSVAFGSPRYTHFHMVGSDPGDICGSLFDATIAFDDEVLWDQGRFVFLEQPAIRSLIAQHGLPEDVFASIQPIGL